VHLLISEVEYMHGRSGGLTRTIPAIFWAKVHALDWRELHHQTSIHVCLNSFWRREPPFKNTVLLLEILAGFCSGDRCMMNTYWKKQTLYGYQQIKQELKILSDKLIM
jgi:hypothetical protein